MIGNIHDLGLGILEKIANEVGTDLKVNNLYESIKPTCQDMMQTYFPNPNVEINPLVMLGYKLLTRDNVERKIVSVKEDLGK